ncbi:MAG: glucosamine-6-phosphate deaminase [Clostridia bacterium]|nr:glucosamine-6-phosphate deaminase [Clostridia bacterium]
MKVIVANDYEEMSQKAFEIMADVVKNKPDAVLGLATGTTPLGLYGRMIKDCKANGTSYKNIKTVNLDEYAGLDGNNKNSYASFMKENLFNGLDIDLKNTHIENGSASDAEKECERYNKVLCGLKQDIQLLGLGSNGHIAFNEPGTPFGAEVHIVNLAESTIRDNSRLFDNKKDVPVSAYTMGPKNIMQAKKILVLASGANKADAVYGAVKGEISESLPASVLQLHPDCIMIVDKEAAARL